MSNQQPKKRNPIFAEIMEANDERTVAALVLFERRVKREFHGPRHLAEARAWVATWTRHLDNEWLLVKDTTAAIMFMFTAELRRRGVEENVIEAALEDLVHNNAK